MANELVTVVVCTYNRADGLMQAIETLLVQDTGGAFDYEVLVIDDGSTDNTAEVVRRRAATAPVALRGAFEGGRRGIGAARNSGIAEARGVWIAFFDDDQLADRDWLAEMLRVAREQSAACVGGARKLDLPGETLSKLGPVCRGMLGENLYTGPPHRLEGKELPTTGSLLLARKIFDTVGVFDADSVTGGEDLHFLGRSRRAGFDVWAAPRSICAHIIPPHRLQPRYLRWVSLRWGNNFARSDFASHGHAGLALRAIARFGQAALINLPRLLQAAARGDAASALDCRLLIWRSTGYVRTALHLLAPQLFPQRRFLDELEFRNERAMFAGTA